MSQPTLAQSASEGNPRGHQSARLPCGSLSGFAMLAGRIRSWTINLLATAIVLVGGLAIGRQVIGWWHEAAPDSAAADAVLAAASLPDLGPGQEFWTRSGALKIEHVQGGLKDAVAAMQAFCRTAADAAPSRPLHRSGNKIRASTRRGISARDRRRPRPVSAAGRLRWLLPWMGRWTASSLGALLCQCGKAFGRSITSVRPGAMEHTR